MSLQKRLLTGVVRLAGFFDEIKMAKFEVKLLGPPHFLLGGEAVAPFAMRKSQALLIYLLCNERPIPRDLLVAMFWPDKSEADARNNMRRVLSDLRRQFGEFLRSDRQTIEFVRRPPFWLDVDDFLAGQRLLRTGVSLTERDVDRLEAALRLYGGEFVAGLNLSEAPAFEDWLLMQREYLREQALAGLGALTEHFIQTGQVRRGLASSQQLLALEPWQESAYQQRMLLLAWNGERTAALQLYGVCKQVLVDEFGLPPNAEITDLYRRIKAGALEPPPPSVRAAARPTDEPEHLERPPADDSRDAPPPDSGHAATPLLLSGKVAHPGYTTAMLDRPRLYRRLDDWRNVRGLAIFAQAGYGKSSLVSRWLDISGLRKQAAWVNLDEGDADPARFVYYVAAALETVRPGALELVQPILTDQQGGPTRGLYHLLSAFDTLAPPAAAQRDVILVLDDLQRVQSPAVDALLLTMLEHGPPTLHLILLARHRTELRLARLRAQEKLAFLSVDDLRFTEDEVAAYLSSKGFDATTEAEVAKLTRRSEGWVTALQLAVLSLRHPGDVGELLDALQGEHDWLADYLVGEVLDRQTPELQRFLLETSILDEFNAPLCAAVTGDVGVYGHLATLASADLFLVRLNYSAGWSRYHHLFQELLQHRLRSQTDPAHLAALHHNAARWLANTGRASAAVDHLLAAGEEDAAAELVETQLQTLLTREPDEARRLIGLLPAPVAQRRPRLMLDRCFLSAVLDYEDGEGVFDQARATLDKCAGSVEAATLLQAEWWVLRSGLDFKQRDFHAAESGLAQAEPHLAALPDLIVGMYWFLLMHLKSYAGDHPAATDCGDHALAVFARAGFALGEVAVQRELARWSMKRGDSRAATQRFQALFAGWQREQLSLNRDVLHAQIIAAKHTYLQNELAQARFHCEQAHQLAQQLQDDEFVFLTRRMGLVYAAIELASATACPPMVQPADHIRTRAGIDTFLDLEISWLVVSGQGAEAWSLIQQFGLTISHSAADYIRSHLIPYLRAYIARGEALAAISTLLAGAAAHYAATGARLRQLQVLALTAWQQMQLGDDASAGASLAEAQRLAQETGYVRVVMDLPALAGLLGTAGARS